MKKIIVSFLLVVVSFLFIQKAFAQHYEKDEMVNLLNLTKLTHSNRTSMFETEFIDAIPGETYTIVFDKSFAYRIHDEYERNYLHVETPEEELTFDYSVLGDLLYAEFEVETNQFKIIKLYIDFLGGLAMIYKGEFADFKGFIPYYDTHVIDAGYLTLDYDDQKTVEDIKNMVTIRNPHTQQNLAVDIVSNDYSDNYGTGEKNVVFQTVYNHEVYKYTLNIDVVDTTAPLIVGPDYIAVDTAKTTSSTDILKNYRIEDNADILGNDKLVVASDEFMGTSDIGIYEMVLEVKDKANNLTSKTVTIEVLDKTAPFVSGPTYIYIYNTDNPLTMDDVYNKFEIYDEAGNEPISIEVLSDTYLMTTTVGRYRIRLRISDSVGNYEVYAILIEVLDNKRPEFIFDDLIMETKVNKPLENKAIVDYYKDHMRKLGHHVENVEVIKNEYEQNTHKEGSYYVYLAYDLNSESHNDRVLVHVDKNEVPVLKIIGGISILAVGSIAFIFIKKRRKYN